MKFVLESAARVRYEGCIHDRSSGQVNNDPFASGHRLMRRALVRLAGAMCYTRLDVSQKQDLAQVLSESGRAGHK